MPALRSPGFVPIWRHEDEHVLIYGRGDDDPSGLALAGGCLYVAGTATSRSHVERSVLIKYQR